MTHPVPLSVPVSGEPGARPLAVSRRAWLGGVAGALAGGALTGCGFHLRQAPQFAFKTLVASLSDGSPLQRELHTALLNAGVEVVPPSAQAPQTAADGTVRPSTVDAVLTVLTDQRERSVVGSTAAGQVREFQLRTRFKFRLSTPRGKELIPDAEILLQRELSYSETIALSKADEEAELYRDMQADIVQQTLRRLAAVRSL